MTVGSLCTRLFVSSGISAPACRLLPSPFIQCQIRERMKENRKTPARKIYEMLDLDGPYKILEKEVITDHHPRYFNRVNMDETNPHFHEKKTYVFNHRCRLEEGVNQALWLTKSKLMNDGQMPDRLQELASRLELPNMEERVLRSIRKCRQYDTESKLIPVQRYSYRQLVDFMKLCHMMIGEYPDLLHRVRTDGYYVAGSWHRGEDQIQVRGRSGLLVSSSSPLPRLAGPEEVAETANHTLPDFYPLAPTIDLLTYDIYKDNHNFTGFFEGSPFPHAHTLYIHDSADWCRRSMDHLNAKGLMFAFANAFSRAKLKHGDDANFDLDDPIVTQCVVSTGVKFTFIQVQLNTLNMAPDDGIKNMVWLDEGNTLFSDNYPVVRHY